MLDTHSGEMIIWFSLTEFRGQRITRLDCLRVVDFVAVSSYFDPTQGDSLLSPQGT